jgi:alpha-ribazole phosphatase
MLEIVLVRHGQVEHIKRKICYGWTDMELNNEGKMDAHRAGATLKDDVFDAVYASPLMRAVQTAEIVLEGNKNTEDVAINLVDDLKEYNFGHWEGMPYSDIQSGYPEQWNDFVCGKPEFKITGGESFTEFAERVGAVMDGIKEKHPSGRVLVVSHWGCISVIIPYMLRLKGDSMWKFAVRTGGVSRIEVMDDFARLTKLNV